MRSCVRRGLSLMSLWLLCAAQAAVAAEIPGYRVAGVITGDYGNLAIIERPEGGSVLVGPGDELDAGQVIEIDDDAVWVRFTDEEWLLPLSGGVAERRLLNQSEVMSADRTEYRPLNRSEVISADRNRTDYYDGKIISTKGVIDLGGLSIAAQTLTVPTRADEVVGSVDKQTADARIELTNRLRSLFGLPAGFQVVDINGESVTTASDSVSQVEQLLGAGDVVRLSVTGAVEGPIYIYPP